MRLQTEEYSQWILMLVCLFKVYHDAGIDVFERFYAREEVDMDYFYEFILEAVQNAAPIVESSDSLYRKFGYVYDDSEVNIFAYSSKEFQEYYRIARKLHRLEGCKTKENPYIRSIERRMEGMRGFESYSFDYFIGHKRKGARMELLWGFEFECELPMCLWIVRVMTMMKEELPILKEKYRKARREKRSRKGGLCHAA